MKEKMFSGGRPDPGLLPREWENSRQAAGATGASRIFTSRSLLFPLPGGEGQGEGERSPISLPTGPVPPARRSFSAAKSVAPTL